MSDITRYLLLRSMLAMRHGNFSVSLLSNLIRNVRENNVSHIPNKIISAQIHKRVELVAPTITKIASATYSSRFGA